MSTLGLLDVCEMSDILNEFITDINAVGTDHVKAEWPDLWDTYCRACKFFDLDPETLGEVKNG